MLTQTDREFAPTLLVLVLELDAGRTARNSLGHRDHSVLDKDACENRRFPQPGLSLRGMRAGPDAGCDYRTGFFRIAQLKLQSGISAHAQTDQMGAFDLEIPHHAGAIVDPELPTTQRSIH